MHFADCLKINRSVVGVSGMESHLLLPGGEHTPMYRRQVGSVFSIEYSGALEASRVVQGRSRPPLSFLF